MIQVSIRARHAGQSRAALLPLLLFLPLLLLSAVAATQEQKAKPHGEHSSSNVQQAGGEPNGNPGGAAGQQLAKESREPAGEEKDETAEFKESPSVRFLARITHLSLKQAYWLSVVLNFAVIAGLILWFSRSKLPGMFRARTESIQRAMEEARKASEEARNRLAQVETRLAKLGEEIATMRAAAEQEAAGEEARIKAAAQEDARKIVESAEQEIAAAAKSARRELTAYAADLAVSLAKRQILVDSATDQSLVRGFAEQLSASGPYGGGDKPGKDRR